MSADLIKSGKGFHNAADDVSRIRLPYLMVIFLFGTNDVVEADRRVLAG